MRRIEKDVYSDIEDPKEIDLSIMLHKPEENLTPNTNDLSDIIKKSFGPNELFAGSAQTKVLIDNGVNIYARYFYIFLWLKFQLGIHVWELETTTIVLQNFNF